MILKRLYEEYDLAIERILIKEYKRLKLTMPEMSVLLALFSIYKKRKTFSIAAISRRVEYNQNEIGFHVDALLNKGFVTIGLEKNKDDKEREVFELEPTFKKIQGLYHQDELEKIKEQNATSVAESIKYFEQGLGRLLLPYELENIRQWYDESIYTHEQIIQAIKQSGAKTSIKYVERILTQNIPEPVDIDPEVEGVLDDLYKKIR
ncbi:MAG: DnaD domain protein [Acholeplasmataceae bacterium]|nr:DnaD domain protein [Acholeplasmataceae bacterium]